MNDDDFDWDDAKATQNYADHSVSFEAATRVFEDPFATERLDDARTTARTAITSSAWSTAAS
jgi:uncharacterized DUF497 family protein